MRRSTFISVLILSLLCGSGIVLSAQNRNLFLELGGSGGLGSINFEKTLWDPASNKPVRDNCGGYPPIRHTFTWRAGFSVTPVDKNNGVVLIFPLMANVVYGFKAHKLEAGAGMAPSITTKGSWYIKTPLALGYRYEPDGKQLFYRVTYTPIVGWLVDYNWQHWAGISIGYKLK
ncbi:MAG: hypothetical protein L6Q81_04455 [Bacteroidia bacterium]|nr:hypothetical protein [Bacteroidia bacterium]